MYVSIYKLYSYLCQTSRVERRLNWYLLVFLVLLLTLSIINVILLVTSEYMTYYSNAWYIPTRTIYVCTQFPIRKYLCT